MFQALVSDAHLFCKVIVYGTMVPAFFWMLYLAVHEMRTLHRMTEEGNHINGEELHNVEHFAVFGFFTLLAFWMVFMENSINAKEYLIHMAYLSGCVFYLFPHLIEERKRYFHRIGKT